MNKPGAAAFIQSLYSQYAAWGVVNASLHSAAATEELSSFLQDLIKHDCVFGQPDSQLPEVLAVSDAIQKSGRTMVYSLSPGTRATLAMGQVVAPKVNMYRVSNDVWDNWPAVVSCTMRAPADSRGLVARAIRDRRRVLVTDRRRGSEWQLVSRSALAPVCSHSTFCLHLDRFGHASAWYDRWRPLPGRRALPQDQPHARRAAHHGAMCMSISKRSGRFRVCRSICGRSRAAH